VRALGPEDFVVTEDETLVRVTSVDHEDGPVLYAFLVDVSGSMDPYIDDVERALSDFVPTIRADDTVMVASFADALDIHLEPTDRRDEVERAIRELPSGTAPRSSTRFASSSASSSRYPAGVSSS